MGFFLNKIFYFVVFVEGFFEIVFEAALYGINLEKGQKATVDLDLFEKFNVMLSKKTRYAILALTKLAKEYGNEPIQISEIASSEKIPQRFLENILLELKKAGILGSKLGKTGGYYLLKHPDLVTLADIIRHFEGTIAMIYCVSEKSYQPCEFCKDEQACTIRGVFKEIRDTTFDILTKTTLTSLIVGNPKQL